MTDRQVQSLKPSGSGANSGETSDVLAVCSGFPKGTGLQEVSGVRNEVVHTACTRKAWLATLALCILFVAIFLGSLWIAGAFAGGAGA